MEQRFGKMSSRQRCRRARQEPYLHQVGPPPPRARSPQNDWCDPLWEQQHWRARGRMHLPSARQPRPFHGPADILRNEESWRKAPRDRDVPPPPSHRREDQQSREPSEDSLRTSVQGSGLKQRFGKMSSRQRCRRGPWTFPWGPYPRQAGPLPPRARSPQDDWCDPLWEQQHWRARGRMHLPGARQPRPFPGPADILQNEENWIRSSQNRDVPPPPWMYREDQQSHKIPQLRHRDFLAQPEFLSQEQRPAGFPWEQEASWDNCFPRRHYGPRRRRYRLLRPIQQETADCSRSPRSSQGYHPSCKPSRSCSPESQPGVREQLAAPQSPAACRNSLQSQQQVGEGQLVASSEAPRQPGHAEKSPEKSPGTDPQAAEQEPAAGAKPVEPEGGEGAADNEQLCALELEPVSSETSSTSEEEGLELIPLEVTAEPSSTQPSTASSSVCTEAAAPARTGQPPWAWTELAAGFQGLPRPPRSAHSPTGMDLRSAAILTKKESIEQGYHDFCLQFALVSAMLLQKEPSMEALLMKALRANLSELRNQLLKELQDFIQHYDATHPSC
ncbi:serine/arginine repetitive matrix protein 1-like isoform X1 [Lagopus leucura]|uniref:serine/arginine repetitive matrix protein 1-like isoform X1 n=1 Tax=Lagopus leucura TaxID=30410 RepID=UPI001C679DC9|nr:serine/arginine repetitive matrix protein 1-like isoform X1 [Lagopus leucura]